MKLKTFLFLMLAALFTVSCEEDEDVIPADVIMGTYTGTMKMKVGEIDAGTADITVVVTKVDDKTVNVRIPKLDAMNKYNLTDLTAEGINVASYENTIVLTGYQLKGSTTMNETLYDVESNLLGVMKNDNLTFDFTFKPGPMPMSIQGQFEGSKK